MRQRNSGVWVAQYGMLIALAFVLSFVETLVPVSMAIPGMKLGLANLVVIVGLYTIGVKGTIVISLLRIVLVGLTFGNLFSMIYSLAGGGLSLVLMTICKKTGLFSQVGISIIGGIGHNIGQLIIAAIVVEQVGVFFYFPALLIAGSVAGVVVGILGNLLTSRIQKFLSNYW